MTITAQQTAPSATRRGGAAPAGLNPAQVDAWERLVEATAALPGLPPLDPTYLADEAAWETWRQANGDD